MPTRITRPDGVETQRQMGATGRIEAITDGEGRTLCYGYDAAGRVIRRDNPDGGRLEYDYDKSGLLMELRAFGPGAKKPLVTTYAYDDNARLIAAANTDAKITLERDALGVDVGHRRVGRLMRESGIVVERTRKFKATTDSDHRFNIAPNLLDRVFTADRPNQKWAGDISYIWTREGWLYLAVILDLHSRRVIGWSVSNRMKRGLAIRALKMAIALRSPPRGCLFHSDRGSQYFSHDYQKVLRHHRLKASMSGKGNCYDNAAVDRRGFSRTSGVQAFHHPGEDALVPPPLPAVVRRLRRAIFLGRIAPPQAVAIDEYYPAQDMPVIDARLAVAFGERGGSANSPGTVFPTNGCSRAICSPVSQKRLLIVQSPCRA